MVLANIFGPDALFIVVLVGVLLFGAGRLPKLARSLGEASKEFKDGQQDRMPASGQALPAPPADAGPH